jgi:hypothetical protein
VLPCEVLLCTVLLCVAASAQFQVGDDLDLNATGTISTGYNGSYGNQVQSSHGLNFGGTATVNGFFYNPKFLSFSVNPYYNQSRANSTFQSISDSTGVAVSSNIFAGSHFPGSVFFNDSYNKEGAYSVPGAGNFVTSGSGKAFGGVWSENLPDAPSVTVGYTRGDTNYSVYGMDGGGETQFQDFYLHSGYRFEGFNLSGGFNQGNGHTRIPPAISGEQSTSTTSDSRNYNFAVSHLLPMSGGFSTAVNRTDLNSDYLGYSFHGAIDTVSAVAGINPTRKWNVSVGSSYSDNLSGQIYQSIFPTGVPNSSGEGSSSTSTTQSTAASATDAISTSQSSHAWDLSANTTYSFAPSLQMHGEFIRREQVFRGVNFSSDSLGAGVIYSHPIAGGYLNGNVFASDNRVNTTGDNRLGLTANGSFNRYIKGWNVTVGGSYGQDVQTLLISYTTSNYSFNGIVSRRFFRRLVWSASAGEAHSGLTADPHTSYASQSYSTGLGIRRLSFQASYSKSDGNGLASAAGITAGTVPPVIPSALLTMYGGKTYSFSLSSSPVRRLTLSSTYAKSDSNTTLQDVFSSNHLEEEIFFMQYQFRKVGMNAGFSRLVQGFSASGTPPAHFSSFYIGVYRWFNFF